MAKEKKVKKTKKSKAAKPTDNMTPQERMALFLANRGEGVEKKLRLLSNTLIEPERVSSGVLQIDWLMGGGFAPSLSLISGEEQSAKTTTLYHTLANSISKLHLPYNGLWDAEGSVSPKYTARIWEPFGLDVNEMISKSGRKKGFYYFRNNVIEQMFDYLKQTMKLMPDKNWNSDLGSWAYYMPKRDDHFKKMIDAMGWKVERSLSAETEFYIVGTDYSGPEAFFGVDSFASLVTREEEDKDETGNTRSALEAAEFSKQLKRVIADMAEKKVHLLGTNQLRSHVRQQYGGPDKQEYDSGGNALRFYSNQRARYYSRSPSAAKKHGPFDWDKESSAFGVEQSVENNGTDRYAYKEVKNTKNKFGKPGLKTLIRVWVSDGKGNPRGIDPAFDVYMHLRATRQIAKAGNKLVFTLLPSVGKSRAGKLNDLKPFTFLDLKALVVAEYTSDNALLKRTASRMGIDFKPALRESLFAQMKNDPEDLYSNIRESSKTEEEEMDEDNEDYESEEL